MMMTIPRAAFGVFALLFTVATVDVARARAQTTTVTSTTPMTLTLSTLTLLTSPPLLDETSFQLCFTLSPSLRREQCDQIGHF